MQLEQMRVENAASQAALLQQLELLRMSGSSLRPSHNNKISVAECQTVQLAQDSGCSDEAIGLEKALAKYRQARACKAKANSRPSRYAITLGNWLTGHIWNLALTRSEGSWTCSIQTWNVIPGDSPIFQFCADGNLDGVQRLTLGGQASFMDCNDLGETLLDVSEDWHGLV